MVSNVIVGAKDLLAHELDVVSDVRLLLERRRGERKLYVTNAIIRHRCGVVRVPNLYRTSGLDLEAADDIGRIVLNGEVDSIPAITFWRKVPLKLAEGVVECFGMRLVEPLYVTIKLEVQRIGRRRGVAVVLLDRKRIEERCEVECSRAIKQPGISLTTYGRIASNVELGHHKELPCVLEKDIGNLDLLHLYLDFPRPSSHWFKFFLRQYDWKPDRAQTPRAKAHAKKPNHLEPVASTARSCRGDKYRPRS